MNNLGCIFIENGINFEYDLVSDCCIHHHGDRGLPKLIENYHGGMIDWENIFDIKEKRIKSQQEKTIYECEGCYHLWDYEFKGERKISEFHFSHCRLCNAKCVYCCSDYYGKDVNYDTYSVVKDLMEKGYYKSGGEATFQGGEPTYMQNFEELINLFMEKGTIVRVHSSAIKYSEKIKQALALNKGTLVVSLDSGTKETYKKIKQVDCFDLVLQNIKQYAENGSDNIIIKYLIVPGYNDNLKEINSFFKIMRAFNIKNIALDVEVKYAEKNNHKDVSKHIYLIHDYFEKISKEYNMKLIIYSYLVYVLKERKFEKTNLINNKILFSWYFNRCKNKSKNISYI